MEKWEILRNVLRKKKVTPRDSLRELKTVKAGLISYNRLPIVNGTCAH